MEQMKEVGIKYKIISLGEEKYIGIPDSLVEGEDTGFCFVTEDGSSYPIGNEREEFQNPFVVHKVFALDELEYLYEMEGDEEFLKEFFFEDQKNSILYIDAAHDGYIDCDEINLEVLHKLSSEATFYLDEKSLPAVSLNENALKELLGAKSIKDVRVLLERYKGQMKSFSNLHQKKGLTKINVVGGKVDSIEVDRNVQKVQEKKIETKDLPKTTPSGEVSYQGLRKHLRERIYGHDEEIDTIAQKLYMNYTAEKGETIESILLVGPTGTGKTETIKAACEYLDIPSVSRNASNIVPQGIKGMSIEDVISDLYEEAGQDVKKAERGLVFLDEFDKLNDSDLDIKASVKNILLTFTAGGTFPIDNDRYHFTFDSSMTSKVYAGVFERILEQNRNLGFGNPLVVEDSLGTDEEIRRKIIEKHYFTQEELTRITTILGYKDLDRETKRRILLDNKYNEFFKKKKRYQRQFGVDLIADESYVDAVLDSLEKTATGMRSVNNLVKKTLNEAERALLEGEHKGYKRLVLTRNTVEKPKEFDLS